MIDWVLPGKGGDHSKKNTETGQAIRGLVVLGNEETCSGFLDNWSAFLNGPTTLSLREDGTFLRHLDGNSTVASLWITN